MPRLRGVEQALSEKPARADGDLRLLEVIPRRRRVRAVLVEEHEQAVALVLLEQLVLARGVVDELVDREHRRDCRDSQRQRDEQVLRTRTACNERHRADCKIHKARAQVGLRHDG